MNYELTLELVRELSEHRRRRDPDAEGKREFMERVGTARSRRAGRSTAGEAERAALTRARQAAVQQTEIEDERALKFERVSPNWQLEEPRGAEVMQVSRVRGGNWT